MTEENDLDLPTQRDIDFLETVENLQSDDMRATTLQALGMSPLGDERILPYLEEYLCDTTPCIVGIPYRFGEVRWLAAYALAKERRALGSREPVRLHNVIIPLSIEELETLVREEHIQGRGGINGALEKFAQLQELEKLPRYDLELNKGYVG